MEKEKKKTFYFQGDESGEEFFVEAHDREEAWKIAKKLFDEPLSCYGPVTEYEAECWGFDTYQSLSSRPGASVTFWLLLKNCLTSLFNYDNIQL